MERHECVDMLGGGWVKKHNIAHYRALLPGERQALLAQGVILLSARAAAPTWLPRLSESAKCKISSSMNKSITNKLPLQLMHAGATWHILSACVAPIHVQTSLASRQIVYGLSHWRDTRAASTHKAVTRGRPCCAVPLALPHAPPAQFHTHTRARTSSLLGSRPLRSPLLRGEGHVYVRS